MVYIAGVLFSSLPYPDPSPVSEVLSHAPPDPRLRPQGKRRMRQPSGRTVPSDDRRFADSGALRSRRREVGACSENCSRRSLRDRSLFRPRLRNPAQRKRLSFKTGLPYYRGPTGPCLTGSLRPYPIFGQFLRSRLPIILGILGLSLLGNQFPLGGPAAHGLLGL